MVQGLNADLLLLAYARGIFPMASSREAADLHWIDPESRGIIPLDGFHISRSLARQIRRGRHEIRIDTAFEAVVRACGERPETWINAPLFALYQTLFRRGFAHSLEVWQDGRLTGGVFGIALGGAFFGESMFSHAPNASKIALAYLVERLKVGGFSLLDTQFLTPHLASLGGIEIPRAEYRARLATALERKGDFTGPETPAPQSILQRMTQTS
ncbi:MAG: leucyl/phenylalanyl-tRNA--protein transferase [Paracoccaceae bacterium]